jgi:hypothetical protein
MVQFLHEMIHRNMKNMSQVYIKLKLQKIEL